MNHIDNSTLIRLQCQCILEYGRYADNFIMVDKDYSNPKTSKRIWKPVFNEMKLCSDIFDF